MSFCQVHSHFKVAAPYTSSPKEWKDKKVFNPPYYISREKTNQVKLCTWVENLCGTWQGLVVHLMSTETFLVSPPSHPSWCPTNNCDSSSSSPFPLPRLLAKIPASSFYYYVILLHPEGTLRQQDAPEFSGLRPNILTWIKMCYINKAIFLPYFLGEISLRCVF